MNEALGYTLLDGEALVPATVRRGRYETPVWIQSRWEEGEYAIYIQRNGCGHCSVAMAARLLGVRDVTPYTEYEGCRALFGPPSDKRDEGHFLSPRGVALSLLGLGLDAEVHPYPKADREAAVDAILAALGEGKLVIFLSFPETPDNPFSSGAHYVLLCGLLEDGRVLVANSSTKAVTDTLGIQTVTREQLARAIPEAGGVIGASDTWGLEHGYRNNTGYVTVKEKEYV